MEITLYLLVGLLCLGLGVIAWSGSRRTSYQENWRREKLLQMWGNFFATVGVVLVILAARLDFMTTFYAIGVAATIALLVIIRPAIHSAFRT